MTDAPDPKLVDEAHKAATDAVDAIEAFGKAALKLPADVARLTLNTVHAALGEVSGRIHKDTK